MLYIDIYILIITINSIFNLYILKIFQQGLQAIDEYKIERLCKIKLPFAAIVIALGSLIVAIIALMLAA